MKKIISTLLTIAMLISIVNIPVTMASEDAEVVNSAPSIGLVDFTENYTTLNSTDELVGWTLTPSDHSAV